MQDLTTGPVTRHLLKTTSFMLVTMLFQTLYFLVDLFWVGRLGAHAVAAVGISGNLMFIVLAITQMLGVGATALISHAAGRKDHARALLVFNQSQVLSMVAAVAFLLVAGALRTVYTHGLAADAETAGLASAYLAWYIPASALQFGMVAMSSALRGIGNFKPGMIVQTGTVVLNMVLAPVLIFGWGTGHPLGVAGAALATFIAVVVGTVWLLTWFLRPDSWLRFMVADWKPNLLLWGSMLRVGLPAGAEFALMGVYLLIVYVIARPFGAAAQAGFGIGMRIVQAGFLPVVALGFAVAPVAGQNFGARKADRVREVLRSAVLMATIVMFVFALLAHIAPAAMVRIFSSDPAVVAVGDKYLRILSWNFIASGVIFICASTFQAIGNTLPSLLSSVTRVVLFGIPAVLMSRVAGFRLEWLWYLSVVSVTLQMVVSALLLRRELRRRLAFETAPAAVAVAAPVIAETAEAS
jgi:putative MATE family efflux protein